MPEPLRRGGRLAVIAFGLLAAGCQPAVVRDAQPVCAALESTPADPWQDHPSAAGVRVAYLVGRPAEPGFFKYRLQFAAGFQVAPHRHSVALHMTVLCGGVELARGDAEQLVYAGGHAEFAADEVHAEASRNGAVLEITGNGPVSTSMQ